MFKDHINLILPDEEKAILKAEFDQLHTIDQKYIFWKERFDYDYSFKDRLDGYSISDFLIIPKDTIETVELNKRAYSDNYQENINSENSPTRKKSDFIESMQISKDKETRIDYEIKEIDEFIFRSKYPVQNSNGMFGRNHIRRIDPIFFEGYEDYLFDKKDFDWGEKLMDVNSIAYKLLGIEWAKYREFVKNYLKPEKTKQKLKLTGEQQVLTLLYLGFGSDLETDVQKGELYEYFIENFKHKSILKVFNNVSDYENEKNLDVLIDFFRLLKINSVARKVEDKLENLKQKRTRK